MIFVGAVLVNNFILSRFLGCCPFLGVSKKTDTALGIFLPLIITNCAVLGVVFESKQGRQAILARQVVDCTGDGDVFFAAGANYRQITHAMGWVTRLGNIDRVTAKHPPLGDDGKPLEGYWPLRSNEPNGVENLLAAGRCLGAPDSCDIYRLICPCFVTGEAAGVAAAMAAAKGISPRDVSVVELQKRLRASNVWLG